jgi:hypothetical protein
VVESSQNTLLGSLLGRSLLGESLLGSIIDTFLPNNIPDLILWQDGADTSTIIDSIVSGKVNTWLDKSGNGNNSTQMIPTSRPTTGVTTLNGKNVLDFDGGDNLDCDASLLTVPDGASTLFVVAKRNIEDSTNQDIFMMRDNEVVTYGLRLQENAGAIVFAHKNFLFSTGHTNTNFQLFTAYRENNIYSLSINQQTPVVVLNALNSSPIGVTIGSNGGTGANLEGSIAEIVLYDRRLSNSEINSVNSYLINKWLP